MTRRIIIVAGPTASGKSKYAIEIAQSQNGEIINCDSLQVYKHLQILTSYPKEEDQMIVPHKLFGYLDCFEKTTAADWAEKASIAIEGILQNNKVPIIVGGTGLYINTLINGISPIPSVCKENREKALKLAYEDYEDLCRKVYEIDDEIKNIITKDKHKQMIRAYEVFLETNQSILTFYKLSKKMFLNNVKPEYHIINVDRSILYQKINIRFREMLHNGAIDEVRDLLNSIREDDKYTIFKKYPIFNAIGAKEIVAYLDGIFTLEDVIEISSLNSRRYAKRQITWFKHKIPLNDSVFEIGK